MDQGTNRNNCECGCGTDRFALHGISRSGTPNDSPRPGSPPRSTPPATPTTCLGRDDQWPVQDRADQASRAVAPSRPRRLRHRRYMGGGCDVRAGRAVGIAVGDLRGHLGSGLARLDPRRVGPSGGCVIFHGDDGGGRRANREDAPWSRSCRSGLTARGAVSLPEAGGAERQRFSGSSVPDRMVRRVRGRTSESDRERHDHEHSEADPDVRQSSPPQHCRRPERWHPGNGDRDGIGPRRLVGHPEHPRRPAGVGACHPGPPHPRTTGRLERCGRLPAERGRQLGPNVGRRPGEKWRLLAAGAGRDRRRERHRHSARLRNRRRCQQAQRRQPGVLLRNGQHDLPVQPVAGRADRRQSRHGIRGLPRDGARRAALGRQRGACRRPGAPLGAAGRLLLGRLVQRQPATAAKTPPAPPRSPVCSATTRSTSRGTTGPRPSGRERSSQDGTAATARWTWEPDRGGRTRQATSGWAPAGSFPYPAITLIAAG